MPAVAVSLHPGDTYGVEAAGLAFSALLPVLMLASAGLYALGLAIWPWSAAKARLKPCPTRVPRSTVALQGTSRFAGWHWSAISFALGWLVLALALFGPIDEGADRLLWIHMTQHELLMLIAAPLLVLGRPLVVWLWALPLHWRRRLVSFSRETRLSAAWWVVTTPVVAWALHALALWGWHAPAPYQAAVAHEGIHLLEHACFLGSAIVFWWSLAHGRHGRLGYGAGVLYVFSTGVHSSVLGALMTFSTRSWYPIYDARAAAEGWAPLVDQQLAGLLMWVPAGLVFIVVGLALFAAWLGESDRRVAFGRADTLAHASPGGEER